MLIMEGQRFEVKQWPSFLFQKKYSLLYKQYIELLYNIPQVLDERRKIERRTAIYSDVSIVGGFHISFHIVRVHLGPLEL